MTKPQIRPRYRPVPPLLRRLRDESGLTQRELAVKLKVPQNTIYRMEQGIRRCDVMELIDWAIACGADPRKVLQELTPRPSAKKSSLRKSKGRS